MAVNSRWFLRHLEAVDMSQRKLAAHLGIDPAAVTLLLKGKRKLQSDEAAQLAKLFGVGVDEVLEAAGIKVAETSTRQVPIKGWIDGQLNVHWGKARGPAKTPYPAAGGSGVEGLRVQTGGTAMDVLDGAVAFFEGRHDRRLEGVTAEALGRLCIVKVKGKLRYPWKLRVPKRGYEPGTFTLSSINGTTLEEGVELEGALPVLWMKF